MKRMKVGIDTFGCDHGRSGLGVYLNALAQCLKSDDAVQYELFGAEADRYTYGGENGLPYRTVMVSDDRSAEKRWHLMGANRFARRQGYDLVLYPAAAHMLPLHFGVPGVAIVNDIVSEMLSAGRSMKHELHVRHTLKRAKKVIVASQCIKRDLEQLGVRSERIAVVHNGIDHELFYPREPLSSTVVDLKPFAIQRPYFIYASRLSSPAKKHAELVKAFTLFKEHTGLPHRLVLAGNEGAYAETVRREASASRFASDILVTGFVPHENSPALYAGSDGCVFPSVSEGVGLPVLEAMATGVPVACSKSGALSEIAGKHAVFFDSDDIAQMASALAMLATDASLREKLISGGLEWSRRFSWERTAALIKETLLSIAR